MAEAEVKHREPSEERKARLAAFNLEDRARAGGMVNLEELRLVLPRDRTWFWRNEKAGRFPKRHQLGGGTVVWSAREVLEHLRNAPRGPGA